MAVGQTAVFCLLLVGPLLSCVSAGLFSTCSDYTDDKGDHHVSQECDLYCCGTCTNRYCCGELSKALGGIKQDNCKKGSMSGGQVFLIIFAIVVVSIVITMIVCAFRPGCPMYKMRKAKTRHNAGAVIHTYPGNQPAPYLGPQSGAPYPGGPPAQAPSYPGPQPMGPGYPPSIDYNPALPPSAPPASAPYGPPGPSQPVYPPPGTVPYSQPGYAPDGLDYPPQPHAFPLPYPPS